MTYLFDPESVDMPFYRNSLKIMSIDEINSFFYLFIWSADIKKFIIGRLTVIIIQIDVQTLGHWNV